MASAALTGAVTGALILGLAGRAAMTGVALLEGEAARPSPRGIAETVLLGALLGAVGGVSLLEAGRRIGARGLPAGLLVGSALFAGSLLVSWLGGMLDGAGLADIPTLLVAAVLFLAWGAATGRALRG